MNTEPIKKQMEIESRLAKYAGEDEVISSRQMKQHLSETFKTKKELNLKSNIPSLDKYIVSFEGGELTTISGPTGNGKTLLEQTLIAAFAAQDKNCLCFTYEVPAYQFLNQFVPDIPYFYMPKMLTGNSMAWIEQRICEAKVKFGLDAVFVDHLHFLIDMAPKNNMSLEIGNVMRILKRMALKYNIAFFLLAHTQKTKQDTELDNDSLRDSSFISQESDNVFFIWRLLNTDNEAILKITKNRRFGIMNKKIRLRKIGAFLGEYDAV